MSSSDEDTCNPVKGKDFEQHFENKKAEIEYELKVCRVHPKHFPKPVPVLVM